MTASFSPKFAHVLDLLCSYSHYPVLWSKLSRHPESKPEVSERPNLECKKVVSIAYILSSSK